MFFQSEQAKIFKKHLRKYATSRTPYKGTNRRATSLLPEPMPSSDVVLKGSAVSVRSKVFLSLEANQKSGCLIIRNEKNKSRSGILMYRGRILGCMRGQKKTGDYAFGNQAYEGTVEDLANVAHTDIYGLKDEIAAAAGALFHGQMQDQKVTPAQEFFEQSLKKLTKSNMPGCIVITDKPSAGICIVYIFAGKIVGIHSRKEGWLKPNAGTVRKYMTRCQKARVQSCFMPCHNNDEFQQYSFSLSGLADRDFRNAKRRSARYNEPNIFSFKRLDEERLKEQQMPVQQNNKFIPHINDHSQNGTAKRTKEELAAVPTYSVRP